MFDTRGKTLLADLNIHPLQQEFVDSLSAEQIGSLAAVVNNDCNVDILFDNTIFRGVLNYVALLARGVTHVLCTKVAMDSDDPEVVDQVCEHVREWKKAPPWMVSDLILSAYSLLVECIHFPNSEESDEALKEVLRSLSRLNEGRLVQAGKATKVKKKA